MPPIQPSDFFIVATLVVLEGLLSADNALVLALLVRHLPDDQQKKALLYGLIGAFTLRGIGIFLAKFIMNLWPVCAIGAVYLLGLAIRHFLQKRHSEAEEEAANAGKKKLGFWHTVVLVELTDIVFAVDSILVAVALVNNPNKIWIVYTGGFLGIVLLRLAASFFIALIKKYPTLDHMAYGLVGWAGVKLASTTVDIFYRSRGMAEENLPHLLKPPIFWVVFVLIVVGGVYYAVRHKRTMDDDADSVRNAADLECLEDGGFVVDRTPPPGPPA
jgi:YkoY family integral membrane protein